MSYIIFGEMGAGKSTVADYICEKTGFKKVSLGGKIHSECRLHGNETREEMQRYGQAMREIFGENVWCDYLHNANKTNINNIIIDDARQLNEYDYFINLGFTPIAVKADSEVRLNRLQKRVNYKVNPSTFMHDTERQARECVEKCDITIINNSNINLLHELINFTIFSHHN